MSLTPEQCRAARALLNWSQPDLAKASGIGRATIANLERGAHTPHPSNQAALRDALEEAGIEFLPETKSKGVGVRLRK
ncbi:helix-turn-helix transcriptional regulator [Pelagibius litoralis]|uniref:Helix-turn-helix transcriptional regulator n=1 Tax=Pelagibius litoralis TaxID=374515 RepID=A0A967EZ23_9PROT|nr:helix-turn-helix transcriptional regulator [Pelagibius litoralis]NIA70043.1 helix-turn-helix transcriptional regulator [Pelagibius litoralis]